MSKIQNFSNLKCRFYDSQVIMNFILILCDKCNEFQFIIIIIIIIITIIYFKEFMEK